MEVAGELGLPQEEAVCSAVIAETSLRSVSLFFLCPTRLLLTISVPSPSPPLSVPVPPSVSTYLSPAPPRSPPRCCLAPASAAKFPEAVAAAGLSPETPADILALEGKETCCTPMRRSDDWTAMLRDTIEDMGRWWRATARVLPKSPAAAGLL